VNDPWRTVPPAPDGARPRDRGGLCPRCRHVREVHSERGSRFLLCTLAKRDPDLPRYPPQPRLECPGFAG
jgi:hypothetical protein